MASFTTAAPLRIGDEVPDFEQDSTIGPIKFHEFIGDSWCILFSHPKAFTPICTTELGSAACLQPEFDRRGVKMLAVSIDTSADDILWQKDIEKVGGAAVTFPILADGDQKVATLFNMLMAGEFTAGLPTTVRSVFVISPQKKLALTITYPPAVGRNFYELLRVVDALQLSTSCGVGTPANWKNGDKAVILPSVSDDEARERFPGYEAATSYLRFTKDGIDAEQLLRGGKK